VVTLFHKPSYAPSTRVFNLLKQSQANAAASSTIDQASPTTSGATTEEEDFELDIQETPPTEDQLKSILEYVGPQNIGNVVKGAMTEVEALRVFDRDKGSFARPLVSSSNILWWNKPQSTNEDCHCLGGGLASGKCCCGRQ
jgi:hypothetical protein